MYSGTLKRCVGFGFVVKSVYYDTYIRNRRLMSFLLAAILPAK